MHNEHADGTMDCGGFYSNMQHDATTMQHLVPDAKDQFANESKIGSNDTIMYNGKIGGTHDCHLYGKEVRHSVFINIE